MAYGSDSNVIGLVPVLNGLTYPASATRTTWLDQISAVIDAKLAAKDYTVPATNTDDISRLTYYCTIKVASMAIIAGALSAEWTKRAENWAAEFEQFLKDIAEGDFLLTGQTSKIAAKTGVIQLTRHNRRGDYN